MERPHAHVRTKYPPRCQCLDTYTCNQIEPAFTDFKIGCGGSSTVSLIPPQLSRAPGINPERLEFITYMFYSNKGNSARTASHQERCLRSVDQMRTRRVRVRTRPLAHSTSALPSDEIRTCSAEFVDLENVVHVERRRF